MGARRGAREGWGEGAHGRVHVEHGTSVPGCIPPGVKGWEQGGAREGWCEGRTEGGQMSGTHLPAMWTPLGVRLQVMHVAQACGAACDHVQGWLAGGALA